VDYENGFVMRKLPLTTLLMVNEADVVVMSKVLKIWARKILFGPKSERELPNDPLPGLSPPRMLPKPPIPYDYESGRQQPPSIESHYRRFQEMNPKRKPSKPRKHDPNWPDSMSGL
jgi:hypothetical protein